MSRPPIDFSPSPRFRPTRAKESTAVAGRPPCPRSLTPEERKLFRKLCRQLEERKLLTKDTGELLTLYVTTHTRHQKAMADVQQRGEIVIVETRDKNGDLVAREKPNPWLLIAERAEKTMIAILDRLSFTPINRERSKPVKPDKDKESYPVGSAGWVLAQAKERRNGIVDGEQRESSTDLN